jgi:hypothetical protein
LDCRSSDVAPSLSTLEPLPTARFGSAERVTMADYGKRGRSESEAFIRFKPCSSLNRMGLLVNVGLSSEGVLSESLHGRKEGRGRRISALAGFELAKTRHWKGKGRRRTSGNQRAISLRAFSTESDPWQTFRPMSARRGRGARVECQLECREAM